ncbi:MULTISPECIES: glycoside hydrolase family 3 C-terminal domain-containing protein [Arthrobacter]|uniref:Exo-alpha-(1->6)-L-arabinopyranosidase n=1 Tax=Arthrobacter terricola TaxID=2547396 RepID=A0A4V2ZSL2_9MICC|nr:MULTISPECIES: glycoside hydrolase family 3 C-terminal domain-containing protein [Arthrobacter]MBT8159726.1 glycoside hydrolase family 3 C-terminal domain-containing protein [Arthrobacter sp. GN70]TDF93674.1 beta-glucosidase [Arthrobacter terricola]
MNAPFESRSNASRSAVLASLSLEEKASLTSGADFWNTKAIPGAGVRSMLLTDGPHGVRRQAEGDDHVGLHASVPATCFPPAVALGSTWDPELLARIGKALGTEAKAGGVSVLLGPGINIKRSPLGGRNFEYVSEDPVLTGELGTALVNGIQSQGVGASLKHFAVNNQESDRLRVSADVDPRPLREIYLRGFQKVVTAAQPWTVMCSYNRINGVYASEDPWLLSEVLRGEWGFTGLVVSDWGAVNDRVKGLSAGMDLEMPASGGITDAQIVDAVKNGTLDEAVLDTAVARVLDLADRTATVRAASDGGASFDVDAHHALAREAAGRSIVLLKNEDGFLPLDPSSTGTIAVIGEYARTPRYQGGGSSLVNPTRLENALDAISSLSAAEVVFAPGYVPGEDTPDTALISAAADAARGAGTVVLFLGSELESEGYDRTGIGLPAAHRALLDAVLDANPATAVVLSNGGVVGTDGWDHRVPALLEGWLLGQAGGPATADVLFGLANPSGRLAETIPHRLQDTPAYLDFPGEHSHVRYGEGLFVGYRHYDSRDLDVAYPFGHGLSYTTFAYANPALAADDGGITVRVDVTNTGTRAGHEVVQAYTSVPGSAFVRPRRELKGFAVVHLEPGQSTTAGIRLERADLTVWHPVQGRWVLEGGEYTVEVGASSRDIRQTATIRLDGDDLTAPLTRDSTLIEWLDHPAGGPVLSRILQDSATAGNQLAAMLNEPEGRALIGSFPLGRLAAFPGSPLTPATIDELTARIDE